MEYKYYPIRLGILIGVICISFFLCFLNINKLVTDLFIVIGSMTSIIVYSGRWIIEEIEENYGEIN